MKTESRENRIDYVEFPTASNEAHMATKKFYGDVFDWSYQSWGDDYSDTKDRVGTHTVLALSPP